MGYNQEPEQCSGNDLFALRLQQKMMDAALDRPILVQSELDSKRARWLRRAERSRKS